MNFGSTDMMSQITAESNLEDMGAIIKKMATDREVLLHCAVYLEVCADSIGFMDNPLPPDNSNNRSELIENAVLFYCGHMTTIEKTVHP